MKRRPLPGEVFLGILLIFTLTFGIGPTPRAERIEFSPNGLEIKVKNDTIGNKKILINLDDDLGIKGG